MSFFNTHFQEREPWISNPFFCPRHFFRWPYPPPLRNTRSRDELADHRAKSKHAWTFFSSEPYQVAPSKGFKITVMPADLRPPLGTNVMFKAGFSRHHGKDHWRAQSLSVKLSVSSSFWAWDHMGQQFSFLSYRKPFSRKWAKSHSSEPADSNSAVPVRKASTLRLRCAIFGLPIIVH